MKKSETDGINLFDFNTFDLEFSPVFDRECRNLFYVKLHSSHASLSIDEQRDPGENKK
jgi:hypothetical protein